MRVTQHSGREGSAKHNDRTFYNELTEEERREKAPHIDAGKAAGNVYMKRGAGTFQETEIAFYAERYAAAVNATNERYCREGHAERCRNIMDIYTDKRTKPEEIILQIGTMKDNIPAGTFRECVREYLEELQAWNREHGRHMHILTAAIHTDESSPHAHIRRVWDYIDRDGLTRIGQNKALETAGIPLQDPAKPQGRYNNRKMVFDAYMRGKWQEIARRHGFQIETEPRPHARHKSKAEYITGQLQEEIKSLEQETATALETYREAWETAQEIRAQPVPEPIKKGIGSRKREVIEMDPGEYQRIREAMTAATMEAAKQKSRAEEAERKEKEARKERAALEYAIEHICTVEERAEIWQYVHGIQPERDGREPERDGRGADPRGRER